MRVGARAADCAGTSRNGNSAAPLAPELAQLTRDRAEDSYSHHRPRSHLLLSCPRVLAPHIRASCTASSRCAIDSDAVLHIAVGIAHCA